MEEGGKQIGEMNEMFFWDTSLSLKDGGGGGGGKIDVGVEEESGGGKKRGRSEEELGKTPIDGGGGNEGSEEKKAKTAEQIEFHIQTERERRKKMRSMFSTLLEMVPRLPSKADKSTIVEEAINYIRSLEQDLRKLENKKQEKLKVSPVSTSSIIPSPHQEQVLVPYDDLISREAFLAEYSSSTSITPTNSSTTTPRGTDNSCSPLGSPIMMMNNISNDNNAPYSGGMTKLMLAPSSVMFQTFTSKNLVVSVCGYDAHFSICGVKKFGFYTGIFWVLEKYNVEVKSLQISSNEQSNRTMLVIQATTLLDLQYPAAEIYKAAAREMVPWVSS